MQPLRSRSRRVQMTPPATALRRVSPRVARRPAARMPPRVCGHRACRAGATKVPTAGWARSLLMPQPFARLRASSSRTGMMTSAPARASRVVITWPIPSLAPETTASPPSWLGIVSSWLRAISVEPFQRAAISRVVDVWTQASRLPTPVFRARRSTDPRSGSSFRAPPGLRRLRASSRST